MATRHKVFRPSTDVVAGVLVKFNAGTRSSLVAEGLVLRSVFAAWSATSEDVVSALTSQGRATAPVPGLKTFCLVA